MSTIGSASIQADSSGLITLQCHRCAARFKVRCDYVNDELGGGELFCPVCGLPDELKNLWPDELFEEAKKMAISEVEQMLSDSLKGLRSKYIKIKTTPPRPVDRKIIISDKDYDMVENLMPCCQKTMAIMPVDDVAGYYCPYCGRIIK